MPLSDHAEATSLLALSPEEEKIIRRGAHWAIGLGVVAVLGAILVLALVKRLIEEPQVEEAITIVLSLAVGIVSVELGRRLRSPATRAARQFTALIWLHGIVAGLGLVAFVVAFLQHQRPGSLFRDLITLGGIVAFVRARKVLRSVEADARLDEGLPESDLLREMQRPPRFE